MSKVKTRKKKIVKKDDRPIRHRDMIDSDCIAVCRQDYKPIDSPSMNEKKRIIRMLNEKGLYSREEIINKMAPDIYVDYDGSPKQDVEACNKKYRRIAAMVDTILDE